MRQARNLAIVIMIAAACGGAQKPAGAAPGNDHASASVADDLDVDEKKGSTAAAEPAEAPEAKEPPAPKAPVTFKLTNTANEDLVFSIDKGWQPVIFGFSGKPPKAKPIVMFPKFCTASCDADQSERCPYCPAPEKVKDVKAAEKREVVAPGKSLEVPWDAQVFVYEKTRGSRDGKTTRCECYRTAPVPPATYTVRACGLRITKSATQSTRYQCVEGTMTFPADGPQVVELSFGAQ